MNDTHAWFQFVLFVGALLLITKALGVYLVQVLDVRGRTFLDPMVRPIERVTYRLCGIAAEREQSWKAYAFSLLAFSVVGLLFTYFTCASSICRGANALSACAHGASPAKAGSGAAPATAPEDRIGNRLPAGGVSLAERRDADV